MIQITSTKAPTERNTQQPNTPQPSREEFIKQWFAVAKQLNHNLINLSVDKNTVVGTYTKEDLKKYLKDVTSEKNQKCLRKISRALYLSSSHYRTLINYISTLYNFDYVVEGYGVNPDDIKDKGKYKKAYIKAIDSIETMNIKRESIKIRFNAYLDGVFYGFARQSKDDFYIQQFSPDHCKVSFIKLNGQTGFSFDFSIFNGKESLLSNYPDEFTDIWNGLKSNSNTRDYWVKIDYPNAICIKTSIDHYPVPPYVGVFDGILDIADFKALNKGREEIGNYQLLSHQIPMKDGKDAEVNEFLIDETLVQTFHENISENLPPQVGVVTTPMKIEAIKFERDSVDKNKVAEATSQYWTEAAVSELLFGGNATSTALKYSVQADEASLSPMVEDIQSWYNEYIRTVQKGIYKYAIRILKTTIFNVKDYFESRLKAGQFGVPVKNELVAALGISPSKAYLNSFLENDILELNLSWLPLSSSHTASDTTNEGGAPTKDDGDLTPEGESTKENDKNNM